MMVTVAGGEGYLFPFLSGNKVSSIEFYGSLTEILEDEDSVIQLGEEIQQQSSSVASKVCDDLDSKNSGVAMAALQGLGICLHNKDIVKAFKEEDSERLLEAICKTVKETSDKNACTRALWCIATQNLSSDLITEKILDILGAIEHALCEKNFKSMTVEHEGLNAYIRLLDQVPEAMATYPVEWAKFVYPLLLHGAVKVRDRAVIAMELGMPAILKEQNEIAKLLMADLKSKDKTPSLLIEQINSLMTSRQEIFAMKVWEYYVTILGKLLHHGQLINRLLPFVEMAFKNQAPEIKIAAYGAWKTLIQNFSLNPDIISDGKRVKLIMQVFKLSNAKLESVAVAKVSVWWFFIQKLGHNATAYFETIITPLINFCIGGLPNKGGAGTRTPTSRLGMIASPATPNIPGSPMPQFRILHITCTEILGRLLGAPADDLSLPKPKFTIAALEHDVISSPGFFIKNAQVIIFAVKECISSLQGDLDDGMLYHIWYSLVAHVKDVLDVGNKSEASGVLSHFLLCLQHLIMSQSLPPEKLLRLLQAILLLPKKAISSASYAIGTPQTGMMQGTPVLFILDLLFHHRLLETCSSQERFFLLLEKFIDSGLTNQSGALAFCKVVLQILDQSASKLENRETLWRMWSAVVNPLHEHIAKTNEVNAGDALEHDFTCLYAALLLPLVHLLRSDFPQITRKSMMKTWTELYSTFSRLAAMVTNAEANICCEELCSKINSVMENNTDRLTDFRCVEALCQVVQTVTKNVDFSGVASAGVFNMNPTAVLSPGKFMNKKKQRPLGNLHSLVSLTVLVSNALNEIAKEDILTSSKKQVSAPGLQIAALSIIDVFSTIITHLPSCALLPVAIEKLTPSIARFFEDAAKKPVNKLYSTQVLQKLDKLFLDFVTCLTGRYTGPFDSEMLAHLSPVLKNTFLHPRRPLKNQSIVLWNATFANAATLEYPQELKVVLVKVREKAPLKLPGWDASELVIREDTPISQMSQGGDSEVPLPNIVGLPSPHKKLGSFMNKVASPEVKKSPLKRVKSPVVSGVRKKLGLDDMRESDFVVITPSSAQKKRVLTDHQREVLREKSVLPAMYSNLDASMDRSLMSQTNNSMDSTTVEASQDQFNFAVPGKKIDFSTKQQISKKEEPQSVAEGRPRRSSVQRRKSVTFAFNSDRSDSDQEPDKKESVPQSVSSTDSTASPEKKEPLRLLGQSLQANNTSPVPPAKQSAEETNSTTSDSEKPDVTSSASKVLPKEDKILSQSESDEPDNESQASETILKNKPKGRASRSSVGVSNSKTLSSPEARSRSLSAEKSPKKLRGDGMKKLENWFILSPKKRVSEEPVTIVEDSQQPSPSKFKLSSKTSPTATVESYVEETPEKMEVEETPAFENTEVVTKQLFTTAQPCFVPDSEIVEKSSPRCSEDIVLADSVDFNPVVQLSRLPVNMLNKLSPKKASFASITALSSESGSDDIVAKVSSPSGATVKKIKRRASFKLSKASHGQLPPISPIDMDDIIPSSQDSFGLAPKIEDKKPQDNDATVINKSEKDTNETDAEHVTVDNTENPVQEVKSSNEKDSPAESDNPKTEDLNPPNNPDISPVDISDVASSQDSNATIISKPKRGRKRKSVLPNVLDVKEEASQSVSEHSETQDSRSPSELSADSKRPNRRRSVPKKYIDTDNKDASSTPDKKDKKSKTGVKLRPSETLVSRAYDSSQDSDVPILRGKGKRKSLGKKSKQQEEQKVENKENDEMDVTDLRKGKDLDEGKNDSQNVSEIKDLNEIVSKKCNLDADSDSDDDIPINMLAKRKTSVEITSDDDDLPLTCLKSKSDMKEKASEFKTEEKKNQEPVTNKAEVSLDSLGRNFSVEEESEASSIEIIPGSEITSTPTKISSEEKKRIQKKKMLSNLSIDMKVSPVNKRLRSKVSLKLNRSLSSLQRRRRSPGSPGHRRLRSKSVSPLKRIVKTKPSPKLATEAIKSQERSQVDANIGEVKIDEIKVEKSQTDSPVKAVRQSPRKSPQKTEVPKETSTRSSPRKVSKIEESPQKKSLSPTRHSVNLGGPETPTSATKHQSRARLILERSRLFASRSSLPSNSLHTRKKVTSSKSTGNTPSSPTKSILKPSASENEAGLALPDADTSPPPSKSSLSSNSPTFRPIQLPRMYSPSASPSAGILKKRKLSGEVPVDSPSPPNKQRRVSFNEAVDVCTLTAKESPRPVNRCLDMPAKTGRITSPLVTTTSKVTATQSKFLTSKSELNDAEKDDAGFAVPLPLNKKKEEPSQNSMKSTQESQLNSEDPVCPELVTCTDSIDQILPQLTSSTWIRGLGQLVRSRNIRTVGDLCRLTEYDINNLPIRTPKVATVRQVLQAHGTHWNLKKTKAPLTQLARTTDSEELEGGSSEELSAKASEGVESPLSPKKPLPSVEDALAMSPIKEIDTSLESMTTDDVHLALTDEPTPMKSSNIIAGQIVGKLSDMEDTQESEAQDFEFTDPFGSMSASDKQSSADFDPTRTQEFKTQLGPKLNDEKSSRRLEAKVKVTKNSSRKLLKDIEEMARRLTPEALGEMPPSYLVGIHMHLNTMMTNVIVAQSNNCPLSPTTSQSSQSQSQ